MRASAAPVVAQLVAMRFGPLEHKLAGACRQVTDDQLQRLDVERAFIVAIDGVKMRPTVVARRGTS
jgi:hypothetical protein